MLSQKRRNLLAVFVTALIVLEMIAYVATTPRPGEQFFQIYVLGANRLAADYYPNDDPNIPVGVLVHWYIGTTNFMGNVQLVVIRVRLANQTIAAPDDTQALPSPAPLITEFKRFIQNNETWEFPFFWQVSEVDTSGGPTRIVRLQINNETYSPEYATTQNGYNFRIIIELWSLDVESSMLQFGWRTGGERRVAWLQVWFNMTSPGP
jgi:hypothetical protein